MLNEVEAKGKISWAFLYGWEVGNACKIATVKP
jgi:hypothetical protein